MMKRTVYKVVHATPKENADGRFHYITCLEKDVAIEVAHDLRQEKGDDHHIAIELHHECKKVEENEWGWGADWESYPDNAIQLIEYV